MGNQNSNQQLNNQLNQRETYIREECYPKTVWCGKGNVPSRPKSNKVYTRRGTPYECLRIGFGGGKYSEIKSRLPHGSLQKIKYIGEVYESRFKDEGIDNLSDLIGEFRYTSFIEKKNLLTRILTREGGGLDTRAYNSVLLFLDDHGVGQLPGCLN